MTHFPRLKRAITLVRQSRWTSTFQTPPLAVLLWLFPSYKCALFKMSRQLFVRLVSSKCARLRGCGRVCCLNRGTTSNTHGERAASEDVWLSVEECRATQRRLLYTRRLCSPGTVGHPAPRRPHYLPRLPLLSLLRACPCCRGLPVPKERKQGFCHPLVPRSSGGPSTFVNPIDKRRCSASFVRITLSIGTRTRQMRMRCLSRALRSFCIVYTLLRLSWLASGFFSSLARFLSRVVVFLLYSFRRHPSVLCRCRSPAGQRRFLADADGRSRRYRWEAGRLRLCFHIVACYRRTVYSPASLRSQLVGVRAPRRMLHTVVEDTSVPDLYSLSPREQGLKASFFSHSLS